MMLRAAELADLVMEKAVDLGGVVSGEHGIGFTKIKHLDKQILSEFKAYLKTADPDDLINPGKLTDPGVADRIFAPSFNLIELEARILKYGRLEELAEKISKCVRCGRCKTSCCVFYPSGNLFYHPRNKNLAIAGIIEALLYDAQRFSGVGLRSLRWLAQIADHCTLCHKCLAPCPVHIDSGAVSILEREVMTERGNGHKSWPIRALLGYLGTRSPAANDLFRGVFIQGGGALQRIGARMLGRNWRRHAVLTPFFAPAPPMADRARAGIVARRRDGRQALMIAPEKDATATVFYFPGCGSERLHTDIAAAAIFLLLQAGVRIVLPPPYLCCGYPARSNGRKDLGDRQELRNTIIFDQIRSMLGHFDFDGCVVTCGTCREALTSARAADIFDAPLVDAVGFVIARGPDVRLADACVYHQPCHDSLEGRGAELLGLVAPAGVITVPHCCAEAGTLALTRPDISAAMLDRKRSELLNALARHPKHHLLTNCPACLNGLGRQQLTAPTHIAVALAEAAASGNWRHIAAQKVSQAELINF
jgi:Fe-S oxidoreductase